MGLCTVAGVCVALLLQPTEATVSGTVWNAATNAPASAVTVIIADIGRAARTDAAGHYVFQHIAAGKHHIAVRALGFAPHSVQAIVPQEGELELNFALVATRLRLPTLFVRQAVEERGLDAVAVRSTVDRQMTMAAVRNNPRLTEVDVLSALIGGTVAARAESPNGLHVRGGSTDQVTYLLDGIPVFNPYHAAGVTSAWNPDAIATIELASSLPSSGDPASLSGTVSARTITPSPQMQTQGSVSTTQARTTVSGPIGIGQANFLASVRSGSPDILAPGHEASYVRGGSTDRLLKVELPAMGGHLRLLGVDSDDEIRTTASVTDAPITSDSIMAHSFSWSSQSTGAEWARAGARADWRVSAWRAAADADALWNALDAPFAMHARRRDAGLLVEVKHATTRSLTTVGARIDDSRTQYLVSDASSERTTTATIRAPIVSVTPSAGVSLHAHTLVTSAFLLHEQSVTRNTTVHSEVSVAALSGHLFAAPRVQVQWTASDKLQVSATAARLQQFVQSLRNTESVVGNVFPADLFIGAGSLSVPVAQSDHGILSARFRPLNHLQLHAEAYVRRATNVLLVAPHNDAPFATHSYSTGRTASRGAQFDGSVNGARVSWRASYAWQQITMSSERGAFTPEYGARHTLDAGAIVYPNPSWSLRLSVNGAWSRRTTAVAGPFEWEACNLRDRGCEFSGSPLADPELLGRTRLPFYTRVDAAVRKQWQFDVGSRQASVSLFSAASNLFGRHNVLTYVRDAEGGLGRPIEMRSRAPLVVGMEWRF